MSEENDKLIAKLAAIFQQLERIANSLENIESSDSKTNKK